MLNTHNLKCCLGALMIAMAFMLNLLIPYKAHATVILSNGGFETLATGKNAWGSNGCNANFCVNVVGDLDPIPADNQKLASWTIVSLAGSQKLDWIKWSNSTYMPLNTFSVELAGNPSIMRIYQIINTIAGNKYTLSYKIRQTPTGVPLAAREILVTVKDQNSAGVTLFSVTNDPGTGTWVTYTNVFTALSSSSYIAFENKTNVADGSILDDVSVTAPVITVPKNVYVYDPTAIKIKALPGQRVIYDWGLQNTNVAPDAGTISMIMDVSSDLAFKVGSVTYVDGEIPGAPTGNPATSKDTTPANTGLTVGAGQISYSSTGTSGPWTYTPSVNYMGSYDSNVRAIKVTPTGTMNDGTTTTVGFRIYYQAFIP
jgi:hypothetical protein